MSSPTFWHPVLGECARRPALALRLLGAALRLGAKEGLKGPLRALRLALVALHFADKLRGHDPVVIHAHFASAPATLGLLLARWTGRRFGFSAHASDLYCERINLTAKAAAASHVLTCSRTAAGALRKRIPRPLGARVHVIYHGVEEAAEEECAGAASTAEPLILAVGRFEPKKGFTYLLQACAALRDGGARFDCTLVGAGPELEALSRQITALGLADCVRIAPWCEPPEIARLLRIASVLAVPSVVAPDGNRDNIPNVILEALAHSTPVVASALPAIAEVLGSSRAGILVPPGDVAALAAALRRVCIDENVASELRRRGLRLARRRFNLIANAQQLLDRLADAA